jgi:hypothetical protein
MKAITSKIMSLMLLACFCANFVSCNKDKDEPASSDKPSMVGLWQLCTYENGQKVPKEIYYLLNEDYSAALLGNSGTEAEPLYVYWSGTYSYKDNWITVKCTVLNFYNIKENITRCMAEFKDDEDIERYSDLYVVSISDSEIEAELNYKKVYLKKKASMPSYWRSEFSETPVTPSANGLVSQWDLVSRYVLRGDSYESWWFHTPEQAGITLMQNGALGSCTFWANELWAIEHNAGRVGDKDGVNILSKNCTWTLSGRTLTFTCSAYARIQYDASGNETSRKTVTPATPITSSYYIHTFSASWLTLYSKVTQSYYSFLRHKTTPASVPCVSSGTASFSPVHPEKRRKIQTTAIISDKLLK